MASTGTAKTERLLNLVIALLNTRRFRSAAWIRREVAGYRDATSDEAFARMFERDKNELRDLGYPLETDDEDGYRIPPNEFSLPELTFSPAETAAVGLASRLWSTAQMASAGQQAVRKLREASSDAAGGGGDGPATGTDAVLQPRVWTSDPAFEPLRSARMSRRLVRFDYRKQPNDPPEKRRVQPWGLVSFRGRWYLVGYDLDRQGQRTFRLSRIAGTVSATGRSGAYEIPSDVDVMAQVRKNAEPVVERSAEIRVRPGRAVGLRRGAELVTPATPEDPASVDLLRIPIAGLWDTARKIAAAGADVQVLTPPDLREAVQRVLQRTIDSIGTPRPGGRDDHE